MTNNLLLYGSSARGDTNSTSDVDLLTITDGVSRKEIFNRVNVSYYNKKLISKLSKDGSLFVYHLNKEGIIIIDEGGHLSTIIYEQFCLKNNYCYEIEFSMFLLKELFKIYEKTTNYLYINTKVCWCVRTFYAAIGANNKTPIFSKQKAIEEFGRKAGIFLSLKNKDDYQKRTIEEIISSFKKKYKFKCVENFNEDEMNYRNKIVKIAMSGKQIDNQLY